MAASGICIEVATKGVYPLRAAIIGGRNSRGMWNETESMQGHCGAWVGGC